MSQAWIKVETITPDKIEVALLATKLAMDPYAVVGRLIRIWSFWDQHSTDGRIYGIDAGLVDRMVGHPGFCAALGAVGWMTMETGGISLPNFDRHNGGGTKSRLLAARRNDTYREKNKEKDKRRKSDAPRDARPSRGASPEKKREEEKRDENNSPQRGNAGGQGVQPFPSQEPPCDEAIQLAHEFAFRGGEGTSRGAIDRSLAVVNDLLDAGITVAAIRNEINREARVRSEHPGDMRRRLIKGEKNAIDPYAGFRAAMDGAG